MPRFSNKIIIIISLIFLIIFGGIFYFYFSLSKNTPSNTDLNETSKDFNPFGQFPNSPTTGSATNTSSSADNTPIQTVQEEKILQQISDAPVAGGVAIDLGTASSSKVVVRYIERATGHIYDFDTTTGEKKRISNTTIPKIYEAIFSAKGDSAVIRYLKNNDENVYNFFIKIATSTTATSSEQKLQGAILPPNANNFVYSPKQDKIFYLLSNADGTTGKIFTISTQKTVDSFNSSIKEWVVSWPKDDSIIFVTKADSHFGGFVYKLNMKDGSFSKIFGGVSGLSVSTSPSLKYMLYSQSAQNGISSSLYNVENNLGILFSKTLSEKCTWGNTDTLACSIPFDILSANYPEGWYKGLVSFSDMKINLLSVDSGETRDISLIDLSSTAIDAINLSLDEKGDYLLFINKKDLTLWGLKLK